MNKENGGISSRDFYIVSTFGPDSVTGFPAALNYFNGDAEEEVP